MHTSQHWNSQFHHSFWQHNALLANTHRFGIGGGVVFPYLAVDSPPPCGHANIQKMHFQSAFTVEDQLVMELDLSPSIGFLGWRWDHPRFMHTCISKKNASLAAGTATLPSCPVSLALDTSIKKSVQKCVWRVQKKMHSSFLGPFQLCTH